MHPLSEAYVAFLQEQHRGTARERGARLVLFSLLAVFYIGAVVVYGHEMIEGRMNRVPTGAGLPLAAIAIWYTQRDSSLKKRIALAKHAVPVRAWLIQANSRLFKPGNPNEVLPCLVAFSFELDGDSLRMAEIVRAVAELKSSRPADPDLNYIHQLTADERAVRYRRRQLPASFVRDSAPIYVADLYILRRHLRTTALTESCLLCLAGTESTGLELVPWQIQESPH